MRARQSLLIAVGCMLAVYLHAEEAKPEPDVAALIKRLGAEENQDRETAKKSLIELGDRAVEAVKEAANSANHRTKALAAEILIAIQEAKDPCAKPARDTYKTKLDLFDKGRADVETVYIWSLRWAQAIQCSAAEHLAALEAHLARMKELETDIKAMQQLGRTTMVDVSAADYYVKQAEILIKQAKAEAKKP